VLLLTEKAEVFASGSNEFGQLGVGSSTDLLSVKMWKGNEGTDLIVPQEINEIGDSWAHLQFSEDTASVEGAKRTSSEERRSRFQRIDNKWFHGGKVLHIAAGGQHSLFVTDQGTVYSCGLDRSSQLGQSELLPSSQYLRKTRYSVQHDPALPFRDTPTAVQLPTFKGVPLRVISAAAGEKHSAVIGRIDDREAVVVSWGCGIDGQLGHANPLHISNPKIINGLMPSVEYLGSDNDQVAVPVFPVSVACGAAHTVVLLSNGTLFTFGFNNENQCGMSPSKATGRTKRIVPTPAMLKKFASSIVVQTIFAGYDSSGALGVTR